MIVGDGFFHADPAPGNVFYLSGNRLLHRLRHGGPPHPRRREELLALLLGTVQREPQAVADVLLDWTGDSHGANLETLEAEIEAFVDQYHGTPLRSCTGPDAGRRDHHPARAPPRPAADLALLIKDLHLAGRHGRNL